MHLDFHAPFRWNLPPGATPANRPPDEQDREPEGQGQDDELRARHDRQAQDGERNRRSGEGTQTHMDVMIRVTNTRVESRGDRRTQP